MPLHLLFRNLTGHWLRSLLTILSVAVAVFLICVLHAVVTGLSRTVETASSNRLLVQSAVSLYVDLPLAYQQKLAAVPGVEAICKWHWFGGRYEQDKGGFFAQFGIDPFMEGVMTSAVPFGALFGALLAGRLVDALGRRWVLLCAALLFAIGAAFAAATALPGARSDAEPAASARRKSFRDSACSSPGSARCSSGAGYLTSSRKRMHRCRLAPAAR